MEKKLFLLDAMALIYRAYFALNKNPRITSSGINTSAFLGFANTLLELLRKEKPTHIGVAFDTMAPTARHLEYTQYKANREKMPEDMSVCIPYIKRLLQGMNIPILFAEGYEADDVIGTLSQKAAGEGYTVYMVTPDKDFGQLVNDRVFIYKPARMGNGIEIMGRKEVCEKFGISSPLQVIDMLGLWGDASDNIPGIPGVGEVTARKLLARFGSVENLIDKADEIENEKLREKVKRYAPQAMESKMLATIILNAPVDFSPAELAVSSPDLAAVSTLLDELEMRSLTRRFLSYYSSDSLASQSGQSQSGQAVEEAVPEKVSAAEVPVPSSRKKAVQDTTLDMFAPQNMPEQKPFICASKNDSNVRLWADEAAFEQGIRQILAQKAPTAFFLLPGKAPSVRYAPVSCMAFACKDAEEGPSSLYYYIPACFRTAGADTEPALNMAEKNVLEAFFKQADTRFLACYDLKNQQHLLRNQGIEADVQAFDIMLAHYLLDPDSGHDLMRLTRSYLPYSYLESPYPERKPGDADIQVCLQNAAVVQALRLKFAPMLEEADAVKLLEEMEIPLARVLCKMERSGVRIDRERLAQYGQELQEQISHIEEEIYRLAGMRFNIASPKQLGEVLFERLQLSDKPKHTKTKQFSTAEDVLVKLAPKHPIVEKVLLYRSLTKLKSTYVDALPLLIDARTGRIHTTYNQAVTVTGRLSSQNPNLQNIPVRSELGKEIRRCFVPGDTGNRLLSADYSQIELRIIAQLSGDENMLQDFSRHKDVHTATAANVFNVPPEEVSQTMRRQAKTVNFGIIYGISAFGLADRLQIPRKEAASLIEKYFENYAGLKSYMEKVVADAKKNGYVETLLHRRRYLKDIHSANAVVRAYAERNAVNAPIQGSSADMIKLAMVAVDRRIEAEKLKARMILQVHDELVFDVPEQEVEYLSVLVEEEMKKALPMQVPIEVEVRAAGNWLDAH